MKNLTLTIALLCLTATVFPQSTTLTLPTSDNTSSFNVNNSGSATIMNLNGDAGFYVGGTVGTGTIPKEGAGPRLMWYSKKAAFRAGSTNSTYWDDTNIGDYSTALGFNTKASGYGSVALGAGTNSSGRGSVALNYTSQATGDYSTSMGTSIASGVCAVAIGGITTASGNFTLSMGSSTTASGDYSISAGNYTTAQAFASLVIGKYNTITGTTTSWVTTDPIFVIGNGSYESPANALTVLKDGNMTIAGTLTQNSDIRLKEKIVPLNHALDAIAQITPVYYDFKDKTSHPAERQIGFIAQEIEPLFPELVSKDSQGILSVDYSKMTAVLLQAVKEQQAVIQEKSAELLKAEVRIAELEKNFVALKALIAEINQTQEVTKLAENK